MKLSAIDFRVWSKLENGYIEYPALAKLCSVLPAKVHRADRAIPFIEFDERDDKKEVEFWSGLRDLNNAKIYEGDIVAHYIVQDTMRLKELGYDDVAKTIEIKKI